MPITYSEIKDAEARVEDLRKGYLTRWGWQVTCATPGSYWLWRRDFADVDAKLAASDAERGAGQPGKPSRSVPFGIVMAPIDLAVSMTARCLDDQPEYANLDVDE